MNNKVIIISHEEIISKNISPEKCVEWVTESFKMKYETQLPPKVSIHPQGNDFFTSMPVLLPYPTKCFMIKEVRRISGNIPILSSEIFLYNSETGRLLAVIDGDWITTMRTGAVAALVIDTLQKKSVNTYSFIGLGNTARATALCLFSIYKNKQINIRLLRYKKQAELFVERFKEYKNVKFEIIDSIDELISGGEVIVSCITDADGFICEKDGFYQEGCLLVPVHTRGFQNCDLFFDKIYGDDFGHICGFKYFEKFRKFDEFSNVLLGNNAGRENDKERIIAYNIGLGLHDALYAYKIYQLLKETAAASFEQIKVMNKFWI